MKLVVAVIQAEDAGGLLSRLSELGFGATRIRTAGGFLRETNATVFVGAPADQVERVLDAIRENCTTRHQQLTPTVPVVEPGEFMFPSPVDVEVGGATVFVLDVERFERI